MAPALITDIPTNPTIPTTKSLPITPAIPTFEDMRARLAPLLLKEKYMKDFLWAGIFGSVATGRAHEDSDVNVVFVMQENVDDLQEAAGRDVSYTLILHGSKLKDHWMWGHDCVEALLSARTIYGDRRDVDHLRQEGFEMLLRAIVTYDTINDEMTKIMRCIAKANTVEEFMHRDSEPIRHNLLAALQRVLELLDIPPLDLPIRTMVVFTAFSEADAMRKILSDAHESIQTGDGPIYGEVWRRLQRTHMARWSWDSGCALARHNVDRIMASAKLAEYFEDGHW